MKEHLADWMVTYYSIRSSDGFLAKKERKWYFCTIGGEISKFGAQ